MPAPRYVDAVRRQQPPQSKEASASQRRSPVRRGGESQTTPASSAGQKSTPLPHDPRFIYTFAAAVGRHVTVQVKSGVEFEGVLHGPVLGSKNIHITLKNAKRIDAGDGERLHETLIIPANEFVQLKATAVPFSSESQNENGVQATHSKNEEDSKTESECLTEEKEYDVLPVRDENDMSGFMGDIARASVTEHKLGGPRALVAWDGGDAEGEEVLLEGDAGGWCQFQDQANAEVHSTFNMDNYTSKLDASRSRYTEEEAERIAREIESAPRHAVHTGIDDSGVFDEDEEVEIKMPVETKTEVQATKKRFSWADAVKGKSTQTPSGGQQASTKAVEVVDKAPEKREAESVQWSCTYQSPVPPMEQQCPSPEPVAAYNDQQHVYSDVQEDAPDSYSYRPAPYTMHVETGPPPPPPAAAAARSEQVYGGNVGYALEETASESPGIKENFTAVPEDVPAVAGSGQYYGEPLWGPPSNDPIPIKTHIADPEPLEQTSLSEVPPAEAVDSPIQNEKPKKAASTVVPGISFKDKLKSNLKAATPPKIAPPPASKHRQSSAGHTQTKSQSSVLEATSVAPVQSPRSRSYSGKLISNPRRNELHHGDVGRVLPSEENLLSPGTMPHSPMYLPPHDMSSAPTGMMPPPMVHGPYPDMPPPPQDGHPRVPPPYAGFAPPPPMDMTHPVAPMDPMAMARPPMHYPTQHQGAYPPPPINDPVQPDGEMPGSGRGAKPFQLNPRAKAFKPVSSFDSTSQGPEPYSPAAAHYGPAPPPGEYEPRTPQTPQPPPPPPTDAPPSVAQTPPAAPVPQHLPKPPGTPVEGAAPVEFKGTPPPPGARPPFIPPSNVVTPWPSFPGTGVWHSGLGPPPRPGATPPPTAMMNGFIPPGMPAGYPMFVPGPPPSHYMGGMQDPMWRPPPMPPGPQDRQRMAMVWANHYNRVVPPNKRSWNTSKYPANAGPQTRPGRNPRRTPNGNNQAPPSSFSTQAMDAQPSGEIP